jgi:hypothetical protein
MESVDLQGGWAAQSPLSKGGRREEKGEKTERSEEKRGEMEENGVTRSEAK